MANLLIPWVRYLSDIAHKYVGYPDEEEGGEGMYIVEYDSETGSLNKTYAEIKEAAETQPVIIKFDVTEAGQVFYQYVCCFVDEDATYSDLCTIYALAITFNQETGAEITYIIYSASTPDDYPVD